MKKWFVIFFFLISILAIIFLIQNIVTSMKSKTAPQMSETEIQKWYGNTLTIFVHGNQLKTSIADTEAERELGLSGTPMLPIGMSIE